MGTLTTYNADGTGGATVATTGGMASLGTGTATYDDTDFREGTSSEAYTSNGTNVIGRRCDLGAFDTSYAFDLTFKTGSVLPPSSLWTLWGPRTASGYLGTGLQWSTTGKLYYVSTGNSDLLAANTTNIVPVDSWVRVQIRFVIATTTTGTINYETYLFSSGVWSLLQNGNYTARNLGTAQLEKFDKGILTGSTPSGTTIRWDRIRAENGRTTPFTDDPIDIVSITDNVTYAVTRTVLIADSVGITDPGNSTDNARTSDTTDSIGITDTFTAAAQRVVALAELVNLTDSVTTTMTRDVQVADGVSVTDSVTNTAARDTQIADGVQIGDSTTAEVQGAGLTNATDTVGIGDQVTFEATRLRQVDDPIGITDTATFAASRPQSPADAVGVTDTVTTAASREVLPSELIGITDTVDTAMIRAVNLADFLDITDAQDNTATRSVTVTDQIGITDDNTAERGQPGSAFPVNDAVGITDDVSWSMVRVITIADALSIHDTVVAPPTSSTSSRAPLPGGGAFSVPRRSDPFVRYPLGR